MNPEFERQHLVWKRFVDGARDLHRRGEPLLLMASFFDGIEQDADGIPQTGPDTEYGTVQFQFSAIELDRGYPYTDEEMKT